MMTLVKLIIGYLLSSELSALQRGLSIVCYTCIGLFTLAVLMLLVKKAHRLRVVKPLKKLEKSYS